MTTKADLDYTDNMASAKEPSLTDLRESLDSIELYLNKQVKDNLLSVAQDAFGTSYSFDDDGAKNFTNSDMYDKTTVVDSYTGGDFTISTTGAFTDVDATNASIAVTPDLAGDFRVTFSFSVESVSSNATNETDIRFRLTDGTTQSTNLPRVKLVTGVTATTNTVPVVLTYTYDSLAASLQTVKLQYFITTTTSTTIKILANSTDPLFMEVEKI